jgi:hypothetical protein
MTRLQTFRDAFNAFVAAVLVIATIVSLGSSWKLLAIAAGLAALALLGMYLRSWLISVTLTGILLSPFFGVVNGNSMTDVSNAIIGATVGSIVGGILTVITAQPTER